jgi:hypothetical protein
MFENHQEQLDRANELARVEEALALLVGIVAEDRDDRCLRDAEANLREWLALPPNRTSAVV